MRWDENSLDFWSNRLREKQELHFSSREEGICKSRAKIRLIGEDPLNFDISRKLGDRESRDSERSGIPPQRKSSHGWFRLEVSSAEGIQGETAGSSTVRGIQTLA